VRWIPDSTWLFAQKRKVLWRAGYKGVNPSLTALERVKVNEVFAKGLQAAQPVVFLETFTELAGFPLPAAFQGIRSVSAFVATLGKQLDDAIQAEANEGRHFEMVLLDAWGSEALEALNERLDALLRDQRRGTMRFSPGYGDLSILENRFYTQRLGANLVRVHEQTGVMVPTKSTVCLIGWYDDFPDPSVLLADDPKGREFP